MSVIARALVPVELLEARVAEYRAELAKREMQIVRYRLVLVEHGIDPPDAEGAELLEMWRDCRAVISTASEFVTRLGTSKELLADWNPTPPATNGDPMRTETETEPTTEPAPEPEPDDDNGDEEEA